MDDQTNDQMTSAKTLAWLNEMIAEASEASLPASPFFNFLLKRGFNPELGYYVPLARRVDESEGFWPLGGFPHIRESDATAFPCRFSFFSNPRLIAPADAPAIDRLTNAGFLVVTHEFDPKDAVTFEQQVRLIKGEHGTEPIISGLHKALRRSCGEYRAMCVIYSGRASFHIHMLFDTEHLQNALFTEPLNERIHEHARKAALIKLVGSAYWQHSKDELEKLLTSLPLLSVDSNMRPCGMWRRMALGVDTHSNRRARAVVTRFVAKKIHP